MSKAELLLYTLNEVWEKEHWGEPVSKALEGVTPEAANWRPGPGVHSIVEIVNHMAYWIDLCTREFQGRSTEDLMPIPKAGEAPPGMPAWPEAFKNLIQSFALRRGPRTHASRVGAHER